MRYAEINKRFTDTVTEYIDKGYTINTASMSGSQGEIAHVDLTDGAEIIRINLEKQCGFCGPDYIELTVGRCTDKVKPNDCRDRITFWTSHMEVLRSERFYILYDRSDYETVYGTKEEAEKIRDKMIQRYRNHDDGPIVKDYSSNPAAVKIAKRYLKRTLHKTRINYPVTIRKRGNKFVIGYRDATFVLK